MDNQKQLEYLRVLYEKGIITEQQYYERRRKLYGIPSTSSNPTTFPKFKWWHYLLAFVLLSYVIGQFKQPESINEDTQSVSESEATQPKKSFSPGTEGYISEACGCASNEDKYDEMNKYLYAKDDYGLKEMVLSGHLVFLEPNTFIKVIDSHFSFLEVRITSGQYKGAKCSVSRDFVK